jgi:UDP-N-acetylglucosamine 2-epimerase (non-hydrolysing)
LPNIAVIVGTRPEIIKLAGIIDLLGADATVIHTGQHYDDDLSQIFLDGLGLPEPAHRLQLGALSRAEQIGRGTTQIAALLTAIEPAAVIVQGDTNSALAGALAANAIGVPLVHVEAGLRSYDRAMPEEHNRVLIDHMSDLLAAPTATTVANLSREGIAGSSVVCCGNTVVEAVHRQLPDAPSRRKVLDRLQLTPQQYVLATIHRPENTDDPRVLARILDELDALPLPVIAPLHPRTVAAAKRAGLAGALGRLTVLEPVGGEDFLALAAEAALLVSDSGGVQEEVTVLGVPLVVVRCSTERPEAFQHFATLVRPDGIRLAAAAILAVGEQVREALAAIPSPYGDGTASQTIVDEVLARFGGCVSSVVAAWWPGFLGTLPA